MRVKKTTTLWIISYILVLILPIIISFITYTSVENMMFSHIMRNNRYIVEGKMQSVDSLLSGALKFASSCVNDSELNEIAQYEYPISAGQIYGVKEYMKKWAIARNTTGVEAVYAYLPKSQMVASGRGIKDCRLYYIEQYAKTEGYDEWYSRLNDKTGGFYVVDTADGSKLLYICNINQITPDEQSAVVAVEMNTKQFIEAQDRNNGCFFVFDDNNNLIVSTGDDAVTAEIKKNEWTGKEDIKTVTAGTKTFITSSVKSANSQWLYVYAVDKSSYMSSVTKARVINYIGIALSILLGMILIKISVRKNHKPLEKLVEQLQVNKSVVRDDPDDYKYLGDLINNALNEKNKIEDIMSIQQKVLRDSVLSRLVKGHSADKDMSMLLASFNISLPYESYVAGVIYVDDASEMFFEKGGDEEEKLKQAQFVISNVLEELLGQYFIAYVFRCDELLCFIVNIENYTKEEEEKLSGCIRETYDFARKNFNFSFISAMSDCVCGAENIGAAYQEAIEMMEFKFMIDDSAFLTPVGIEGSHYGDYYYPINKEQSIINAVKNGDYEAALSVLDEVLDRNFGEKHMSGQLARCFIFDILCTIIKSVNEINIGGDAEYLEGLNLYSRITECTTAAAMRDELKIVLGEICSNISRNSNKRNMIADRAVEYVTRHYTDENLSVAMVAEGLGTTPNYLSLIFKQTTGIGLLEHISLIRTQKAKKLLKDEPGMSIEEISSLVGYSNVRTFVRVFRKYENITPAKYRQNIT